MTQPLPEKTSALSAASARAGRKASMPAQALPALKALLLPLLLAAFPSFYHYANNADIVLLHSLGRTLLLYMSLALVVYAVCLVFTRGNAVQAANAAFIFLTFFNVYGLVYAYLLNLDLFLVEDYILLPLVMLVAVYVSWFAARIKAQSFWNASTLIVGVLVAFNLVRIIPSELQKYARAHPAHAAAAAIQPSGAGKNYPDVYYILFDEFAGFDVMRSYWHYAGVDEFAAFLKSRGFYVAEHSRGNSIDTLHLMSERLNYQETPFEAGSTDLYFDKIAHNRVMDFFKSKGYTTVVFDETNLGYPAATAITADYSYVYGSDAISKNGLDTGLQFDDFGLLVAENTMLRVFLNAYGSNLLPNFAMHQQMVYFTQGRIADLKDVHSPKLVYVHLLLPHFPFMFSESGGINPPQDNYNWNYYLGTYKFTMSYAETTVSKILANYDPEHPPVIILQSDHGARNGIAKVVGSVGLQNYPDADRTHILNALLLPGCDQSVLTQDMNPVNTFPIVFNCYFQAGIPLLK